jgi:hypothetical protein
LQYWPRGRMATAPAAGSSPWCSPLVTSSSRPLLLLRRHLRRPPLAIAVDGAAACGGGDGPGPAAPANGPTADSSLLAGGDDDGKVSSSRSCARSSPCRPGGVIAAALASWSRASWPRLGARPRRLLAMHI